MQRPAKSTSLTQLGYEIKPATGNDGKGNEIVFKVKGEAPTFYIKKTKRGRLIATSEKDGVVETTIEGLYNFKQEGEDLVGKRADSLAKVTETQPETVAA